MNSFLLNFLSAIFSAVSRFRGWLYDKSILPSRKVGVKVISVGNLTVGGTGKTPVSKFLYEKLTNGRKVAFLKRPYKAEKYDGKILKVDVGMDGAVKIYGDEAVLLAEIGADVWVGTDKVKACERVAGEGGVDYVIADDAFQHRRLQRDIDIVVFDATEAPLNYRYLPLGRARESFEALKRADFAFVTKWNLAEADTKQFLLKNIQPYFSSKKIFFFNYQFSNALELLKQKGFELNRLEGRSVVLLSALAKPNAFDKMVQDELNCNVRKHFVFSDHHHLTHKELELVIIEAKKLGAEYVLMTEKDAVKLEKMSKELDWRGINPVVLGLRLASADPASERIEAFHEALS